MNTYLSETLIVKRIRGTNGILMHSSKRASFQFASEMRFVPFANLLSITQFYLARTKAYHHSDEHLKRTSPIENIQRSLSKGIDVSVSSRARHFGRKICKLRQLRPRFVRKV